MNINSYIKGIKNGELYTLSKAITLIESSSKSKRKIGEAIVEKLLLGSHNSIRLAVSGSPGTGKSTFIESLGLMLCDKGHRVAVLAVDPSSSLTKGSILGDKTRMENLSKHPNAYIRPSPNSSFMGGVSPTTRESIFLCEAAGYDVILVETVGVGQSEFLAKNMTDLFLLLAQPGSGDELQGIKKGIVEIADFISVTKSDGQYEQAARNSLRQLKAALSVSENKTKNNLSIISSVTGKGIAELWDNIYQQWEIKKSDGELQKLRDSQKTLWLKEICLNRLSYDFKNILDAHSFSSENPYDEADLLINRFYTEKYENSNRHK